MNSPRASWDAVRQEVRAFRASLYPAAIPVTKDFTFDIRNGRVYFIGNDPARSIKNSVLFTANVTALGKGCQDDQKKESEPFSSRFSPTKFLSERLKPAMSMLRPEEHDVQVARWRPLLSDDWLKEKPTESLSREELFMKERRRLSLQGITTYEFCSVSQRILFTTGNIIYLAFTSESIPFTPLRLDTTTPGARLDAKLGGLRRDLVSFVRNRNLWVTTHDGVETQLTRTNESDDRFLGCGVVEFVMQEEFHRFTGYHWAPSIKPDTSSTFTNHKGGVERIVYLQVSEKDVDIVHIPQSSASPLDAESETVRNRDGQTADWEEYKYPRAGRPNATSDIQIAEFIPRRTNSDLHPATQGTDKAFAVQKKLWGPASLQKMFPWMEYIVRFGWLPNGYSIWVFILDRSQTRGAVVRIPLSNFLSQSEYEENRRHEECMARIEILYQETSKYWINVTDIQHFLNDPGPESEEPTQFIWPSESTGFRHLYLVTKYPRHNFEIRPITQGRWPVLDKHIFVDTSLSLVYFSAKKDGPLESHFYVASYAPRNNMVIHRLTDLGFSHTIAMDDTRRWLLSTYSNIEQAPRTSVFELRWNPNHDPFIIPSSHPLGRVNHFELSRFPETKKSKGGDRESSGLLPHENIDQVLQGHEFKNNGHMVEAEDNFDTQADPRHSTTSRAGSNRILMDEKLLEIKPVSGIMPNSLPNISSWAALAATEKSELPVPELFNFVNSEGTRIYGFLYKPEGCLPGRKYPTLLSIYGGPRSQIVTNDYKYPRFVRIFLAVRLGFGVVMIDGRGSADQGLQFEGSIKGKLGTVELNDQIEGLRYLIHGTGGTDGDMMDDSSGREEKKGIGSFIDEKRIAITGWSYGGYLSLMALAQYPDVFKIAIAGAPVTQWELYDSAYTERYMGLPKENPKGYQEGSVMTYIDRFPDGENRLLISHGLLDENVHFKHTEALVGALIKRNKPHRVQMYPSERHGLRLASVNEHFDTLMFYCCINYL